MDYEYERGYENGYIRARREVLEELKEEINNWIRKISKEREVSDE